MCENSLVPVPFNPIEDLVSYSYGSKERSELFKNTSTLEADRWYSVD